MAQWTWSRVRARSRLSGGPYRQIGAPQASPLSDAPSQAAASPLSGECDSLLVPVTRRRRIRGLCWNWAHARPRVSGPLAMIFERSLMDVT